MYNVNLNTSKSYSFGDKDDDFINFALGEDDSVVYKPRVDSCTIDRMSLNTNSTTVIAGVKNINENLLTIPHPSVDGIGTDASLNHLLFVKKENKWLHVAECDYTDANGGKIRRMRIP